MKIPIFMSDKYGKESVSQDVSKEAVSHSRWWKQKVHDYFTEGLFMKEKNWKITQMYNNRGLVK